MSATRAEIDAQRAIAAKAFREGADFGRHSSYSISDSVAEQWAAEQHPYPTVTRPRVVTIAPDLQYRITDGRVELREGPGAWYTSCFNGGGLAKLASLLTPEQLDEVRRGPCGPTETVEAE
jgi:hypothetical protein